MKQQAQILRIIRSTADLPAVIPAPHHRVEDIYDPWLCVACGHPHHGMTRHHRVPKRVAWKIPQVVIKEVLAGDQKVVPMCGPCHVFIEIRRGLPCCEKPDPKYALLSWDQLMKEIDAFDKVAYQRTEDLIVKMKAQNGA